MSENTIAPHTPSSPEQMPTDDLFALGRVVMQPSAESAPMQPAPVVEQAPLAVNSRRGPTRAQRLAMTAIGVPALVAAGAAGVDATVDHIDHVNLQYDLNLGDVAQKYNAGEIDKDKVVKITLTENGTVWDVAGKLANPDEKDAVEELRNEIGHQVGPGGVLPGQTVILDKSEVAPEWVKQAEAVGNEGKG